MSVLLGIFKNSSKIFGPLHVDRVARTVTGDCFKGLRYAPNLTEDVVQFARRTPIGKISPESLVKGLEHLTGGSATESSLLKPIVEECFVAIKSEAEAIELFSRQFMELGKEGSLYILNPSKLEKLAQQIGTSNKYMSELYQQASKTGQIIDRTNIQSMVDSIVKNGEKKIRIVVPDDFSGSGRSLIVNTAEALKDVKFPPDAGVEIVFSPLSHTPVARDALEAFSRYDTDKLMEMGLLNQDRVMGANALNDSEIIREFIEKFRGKATIKTSENVLNAPPFYETAAFKALEQENPDAAQAVMVLLTEKGKGYGRVGHGTMVLVPGKEGVLKTPNNNCGGSVPFALLEGATPKKIKNPNQAKSWTQKRWEKFVQTVVSNLGI